MKLCIVTLLLFSFGLHAQNDKDKDRIAMGLIPANVPWSEGSIMLKDGSELRGLVRYNDRTGIINYENGNDTRSLMARGVVAFEFFDEAQAKQRIFYSLEAPDVDTQVKRYYIFEVLREFKDFAVLSMLTPIEVESRTTPGGYDPLTGVGTYGTHRTEYSQTEFIYFMHRSGTLEPYLRIVEIEIDGNTIWDRTRTKNKFVNEDIFQKYTSVKWPKIEEYADKMDLSFKRKRDILQLLDYYSTLVEK